MLYIALWVTGYQIFHRRRRSSVVSEAVISEELNARIARLGPLTEMGEAKG